MGANGSTRGGWFWVDNSIVDLHGASLGPVGVAVYAVLARHANGDGVCWPAKNTIGSRLGISKRAVDKAIAQLERCGLIQVERRQKDSGQSSTNRYHLLAVAETVPSDGSIRPSLGSPLTGSCSGAPHAPSTLQDVHPHRAPCAPTEAENWREGAPHAPSLNDGEPFAEWVDVRSKLAGRLQSPSLLWQLERLPASCVTVSDDRIQIALPGADLVHQARPFADYIAFMAARVTKMERAVEFVNSNGAVHVE